MSGSYGDFAQSEPKDEDGAGQIRNRHLYYKTFVHRGNHNTSLDSVAILKCPFFTSNMTFLSKHGAVSIKYTLVINEDGIHNGMDR